jgi:hypothetical protein
LPALPGFNEQVVELGSSRLLVAVLGGGLLKIVEFYFHDCAFDSVASQSGKALLQILN